MVAEFAVGRASVRSAAQSFDVLEPKGSKWHWYKYGAIAGLLSGGIMVFVWKFVVRPIGGAWNIYELLPAFIVASFFIIVVSLLTKAPEQEIIDEFESIK